jgi:hypothetical protein
MDRKSEVFKGRLEMRKLISMSVMALLLSVMATTAMAGGVEDCDLELKNNPDAPKGLYGLCIAFWNTEGSNGQDRIRALYVKKAEAAGFDTVIPGSNPINPSCPCVEMLAAQGQDDWGISLMGCEDGVEDEFVVDEASFLNFATSPEFLTYFKIRSDGENSDCRISQFGVDSQEGLTINADTSILEYDACFQVMHDRCPF